MVKAHFDNIRHQILDELDNAKERIVVAVYWFTNQTLFNKLMDKVSEGLKVELNVGRSVTLLCGGLPKGDSALKIKGGL